MSRPAYTTRQPYTQLPPDAIPPASITMPNPADTNQVYANLTGRPYRPEAIYALLDQDPTIPYRYRYNPNTGEIHTHRYSRKRHAVTQYAESTLIPREMADLVHPDMKEKHPTKVIITVKTTDPASGRGKNNAVQIDMGILIPYLHAHNAANETVTETVTEPMRVLPDPDASFPECWKWDMVASWQPPTQQGHQP